MCCPLLHCATALLYVTTSISSFPRLTRQSQYKKNIHWWQRVMVSPCPAIHRCLSREIYLDIPCLRGERLTYLSITCYIFIATSWIVHTYSVTAKLFIDCIEDVTLSHVMFYELPNLVNLWSIVVFHWNFCSGCHTSKRDCEGYFWIAWSLQNYTLVSHHTVVFI